MKILVTAGGQGTKLWPYSREDKPKQFQPIFGDTSLCTETINILLKKYAAEDIFISSKRKFIKYISDQAPQIPLKNYIIEPDVAKDRGPGEGFAFLWLSVHYPGEPFFLVQIDCMRKPDEAFLQMMEDAEKLVQRDKRLITGGIKATEPILGIDYLRLGERIEGAKQEMYEIAEFMGRKSNIRETRELIENFHIVTHSNHYCWYPDLMLDAYKTYHPDWYEALMKIKDVLGKPGEDAAVEEIYNDMEKGGTEEVTRHVMETGQAQIMLLPFRWTDVGTWNSVYEYFTSGDEKENYCDGKVVTFDAAGSLVKAHNPDKLIAIAGVEDLVVVDTDDVLLVVPKHKIDQIKDIQNLLKEKGEQAYL